MIQNELFLKEISDFLRSCTIKNKYFAQNTAKEVMRKYGLSSLPDHFNPYYLRMCGLSTLDVVIPRYLIDNDGRRIFNEDYKYRVITDTDPDLTQLIMVRLDKEKIGKNDLPVPEYPTKDKINKGIEIISESLNSIYLRYANFTNSDGSLYTGKSEIWSIENSDSKVAALEEKMAEFNPDDDGVVVDIITGEIKWNDMRNNAGIFKNAYSVNNRNQIETLTTGNSVKYFINGEEVQIEESSLLNVESEQCTYIRLADNTWALLTIDNMFDMVIQWYMELYQIPDTVTFIRSNALPYVEALVVIGEKKLNWDELYSPEGEGPIEGSIFKTINETIHNGDNPGLVIDVEFSDINTHLGYSESTYPQAGTRINYMRNAYAWKCTNNSSERNSIIYTEHESPTENDFVYSDENLLQIYKVNDTEMRVRAVEGNTTHFLYLNDGSSTEYRRDEDIKKDHDVAIKHCTYEFNGIEWMEVPTRKLFDEEWKLRFNSEFSSYPKLTYTTMKDPFDTESFDEKLILDDNNVLVLDRFEYTGWDKPVYVPTYDKENELTKDFTLYTRFSNHMRDEHIKTALKYHIGSNVYNEACEKYPEYIDFIKGVCYPAYRTGTDLASKDFRLKYHYITGDNGVPVKIATKDNYDAYITNIELAINPIATDPNYTLEKYDSTLLKENEADTIIDCIKKVLKCIRERWDIGEFGYEELYYSAVWATIWSHLPYLLLVQRILNLRTEAVHIDHIWEYLAGKGLKDYRTVMDNDQMVFLYKNIDYLRGNEGKQRTLKILVDKLLSRFNATVRTKSILLDTTNMKENLAGRENNIVTLADNRFNINGLEESVSGDVKLLSEDLEEQTSVISDVEGRIEDYDDIFIREHKSGLIPKLGDTLAEQKQRIAESHDEIEITKHTYAPTKLAEITQGNITSDTARLAMAFIFQTLVRKLSSGSEITNGCVVNAIFHGLSSPKTFTIGECIALIFYSIRKQAWYTFKNKYGEQNFHLNDLWKGLTDVDGNPISVSERSRLIANIKPYEDCLKYKDDEIVSDCKHEFFVHNEFFNDTIPSKADIWLPYIGTYTKHSSGELINLTLPKSVSGLESLLGDPNICINGRTLLKHGTYKKLFQILCPYEYSSLELKSWNDMCDAEEAGTVPPKYDSSLGGYRTESRLFEKVVGSSALGGSGDGTLVGGIVTGSSRSKSDKRYIKQIPDTNTIITSHEKLIEALTDQANIMLEHYQLTRNTSDAFFHFAMAHLYRAITIRDTVDIDLVPGYTSFSEWFESDIELKSVFRSIEEGADQAAIYNSIADNLVSALFPADKMVIAGSIDQTKYAAMKELFQWLGSYNIAYLNTSSVTYETLFLHPVTINATYPQGTNDRPWICDKDSLWSGIGSYRIISEKIILLTEDNIAHFSGKNMPLSKTQDGTFVPTEIEFKHIGKYVKIINYDSSIKLERWSTTSFNPYKHIHYWPVIASGWSLTDATLFERDPDKQKNTCVSLNGFSAEHTASLLYGSSEDAMEIQVYKKSDLKTSGNEIYKTGETKSNFYYNHKSSWTSNHNPETPEMSWRTLVNFNHGTKTYLIHEDSDRIGSNCDNNTATILYGSLENASMLPHFKVAYKTFNQ